MSKSQLYWETIKGAVKNPFFIMFLISLVATWSNGDMAGVIASVIGFVGVKTVVNIGTATSENDKQLSLLNHFFLSSRTWVAVFGVIFCYFNYLPNEMKQIAIALAGGFGLDQIGVAIKGIDFSKFVKAPNVIVNQPNVSQPTVPSLPPIEIPQIPAPVPHIPIPDPETPIILVNDALNSRLKLLDSEDASWAYLKGTLGVRVNQWLQHMLDMNPNLSTIEAVKAIADKYLNIKLTIQDCSNIKAWLGLPEVLHASSDIDILSSFEQLAKAGRLPQYKVDEFMNMARMWMCIEVIFEAAKRVKNPNLSTDTRKKALQEFGISKADAEKAQFSAGVLTHMWNKNRYEEFNPYVLVGRPELEAWAANY